ncbi:MAG: 3-dehydroquinate synthase, partial [Candidatus Krumholzibacteriia bacterium]
MPAAPETTLRLSLRLDGRPSSYLLGRGVLSLLPTLLGERPAVVLLDRGAVRERRARLDAALRDRHGRPLPTLTLAGGETVKSLATLERVYTWLARRKLSRDGTIVGVGGGALLDLAGFTAATWQRGVDFVSAPTTLLAMVDASLGGKTALDVAGVKNNVGAFHPATHVLADPGFLATLPRRQWRSGLAETIKAAVVASPSLFADLERHTPALRAAFGDASPRGGRRDLAPAAALRLPWPAWIGAAARVKARLVGRDFREEGERRALNFGHTLGHALEAAGGLNHGEGVAAGMAMAVTIAHLRGLCPSRDA